MEELGSEPKAQSKYVWLQDTTLQIKFNWEAI